MNESASCVSVSVMNEILGAGWAQLWQGVQISIAAANKPKDSASGWALTYDPSILSHGVGILLRRPPNQRHTEFQKQSHADTATPFNRTDCA